MASRVASRLTRGLQYKGSADQERRQTAGLTEDMKQGRIAHDKFSRGGKSGDEIRSVRWPISGKMLTHGDTFWEFGCSAGIEDLGDIASLEIGWCRNAESARVHVLQRVY